MIVLRPPYLHRVFDALSQLGNTVLLNGDANESISGRAHREGWQLENHGWRRVERIIDAICIWESDHCYWAYANDIARAKTLLKST
jgi:hypothetical protein